MSVQEKFQISVMAKEEAGEPWADVKSVRCTAGTVQPGVEEKFNQMPPGMDIGDQPTTRQEGMQLVNAGATDVSGGISHATLLEGFQKKQMKGTDDQYTGEHTDLFYGDAGGFVERNNYMDRI